MTVRANGLLLFLMVVEVQLHDIAKSIQSPIQIIEFRSSTHISSSSSCMEAIGKDSSLARKP